MISENYIIKDFKGGIASNWIINKNNIHQKTNYYDDSGNLLPSFVLIKNKFIQNGIFSASYKMNNNCNDGIVSFIFKHNTDKKMNEAYYFVEIFTNNKITREVTVRLRKKIKNNVSQILNIQINDMTFNYNNIYSVIISLKGKYLVFYLSQNNGPYKAIIEYNEIGLKYGLIGFGTWNCGVKFNEILLRPPRLLLSHSEKHLIINDLMYKENSSNSQRINFSQNSKNSIIFAKGSWESKDSLMNNILKSIMKNDVNSQISISSSSKYKDLYNSRFENLIRNEMNKFLSIQSETVSNNSLEISSESNFENTESSFSNEMSISSDSGNNLDSNISDFSSNSSSNSNAALLSDNELSHLLVDSLFQIDSNSKYTETEYSNNLEIDIMRNKNVENSKIINWGVCLTNTNLNQRNTYCNSITNIEFTKNECKQNYCGYCCENNIDKSKQNIIHQCMKSCYNIYVKSEEIPNISIEEVRKNSIEKCLNKDENTVYNYCDNNFKSCDAKIKCKIDMCNLCCSTVDIFSKEKTTNYDQKYCLLKCSESKNI